MLTPQQMIQAYQIHQIILETAAIHNVSTEYLIGHTRRAGVAWARFEVMYRARHEVGASYKLIGQVLGGRDHSTIMHGIARYENR
mgnify:CR=1 FL=1